MRLNQNTDTMRAVRIHAVPGRPVLGEVEIPHVAADAVLVRVRACGICGSDLHILHGDVVPPELPVTLGHEAAGEVADLGRDVTGWSVGDRVLINPIIGCGRCDLCAEGAWQRCAEHRVLGVALDGAQADFVAVPARNLVAMPPHLDFAQAAVLADAVAGPYRAIRRSGLRPGGRLAIFGLGGLGLHAAIVARQLYDAHIIGVDTDADALERARDFGVDVVIDGSDERVADRVRAVAGPVDAAVEFVGRTAVIEQALRSLRRGGLAVVMGIGTDRLALKHPLESFVVQERGLIGSYGYERDDLIDLVDHIARGELTIDGTISATFDLDDAAAGYDLLAAGRPRPIRIALTLDPTTRREDDRVEF